MKIGKVPENVLKRVVMGQLHNSRSEVLLGPGIGEDCAALQLADDEWMVMSTDPITGTSQDIGRLGVVITANDLASAGAEPIGVMVTVLLPEGVREVALKRIMAQVEQACGELDMQILGGHTEVTAAVNQPLLSVAGVGKVKKGKMVTTGGAAPGMDVIVTKWIGLEGTSIIAKEKEKELLAHFPAPFVEEAKRMDAYLSVVPEARTAVRTGVAAMHDITEGGVFGALWEMAEASGTGLEIELKKIPLRQETVEICEYFGINPYELISSGSMLMASANGAALVRALEEDGIAAAIVGRTTDGGERVVLRDGERRFLEPPKADALYQIDLS